MSAQAERGDVVAVFREERQEELVLAPGAVPHAVDEEEGRGVGLGIGSAGDGFDVHGVFPLGRIIFLTRCH